LYFHTFSGNRAPKFGEKYEEKARKAFERIQWIEIKTSGLIINYCCPWLGFRPNGFYRCGGNICLIEVK